MKVEGAAVESKKHFVEFYDERSKPSPTGLLLSPAQFWTVIVGDSLIAVDMVRMRTLCFPKFLKYVHWGGDGGVFAGVLVDLSRLATFMIEPLPPTTPAEVERLRRQILEGPAPKRPVVTEQARLF